MWRIALAFTLLMAAGGGYETWALKYRPSWTITDVVKRWTHLSIILGAALFMLLGYALGLGGH